MKLQDDSGAESDDTPDVVPDGAEEAVLIGTAVKVVHAGKFAEYLPDDLGVSEDSKESLTFETGDVIPLGVVRDEPAAFGHGDTLAFFDGDGARVDSPSEYEAQHRRQAADAVAAYRSND